MEKIKAFFQQKWVKITAWVVLFIAVIALIIGGVTVEDINKGTALAAAIVMAIAAAIAFITERTQK